LEFDLAGVPGEDISALLELEDNRGDLPDLIDEPALGVIVGAVSSTSQLHYTNTISPAHLLHRAAQADIPLTLKNSPSVEL